MVKNHNNIQDYTKQFNSKKLVIDNDFYLCYIKNKEFHDDQDLTQLKQLHSRSFFEISIIINDPMLVQIGDDISLSSYNVIEVISPFQFFSIRPIHKFKKRSDLSEIYTIFFNAKFLGNKINDDDILNRYPFFKLHTRPRYSLTQEELNSFLNIVSCISLESKSNSLQYKELLRSYLKLVLLKISHLTLNIKPSTYFRRSDKITSKFELLLSSYSAPFLSIPQYASMINISPSYLTESVKTTTGKSAQQLLMEYKILLAKSLVKDEELTITQIAEQIGFSDNSNFVKFFKKYTGVPPLKFRRLHSSATT
ncbi:helix-turn-helix domain-containing protein [Prolixibacteraceae bacterium]|nr:helix-turn-helix domain-containing protein [Prolixibacteraceae bacterium]